MSVSVPDPTPVPVAPDDRPASTRRAAWLVRCALGLLILVAMAMLSRGTTDAPRDEAQVEADRPGRPTPGDDAIGLPAPGLLTPDRDGVVSEGDPEPPEDAAAVQPVDPSPGDNGQGSSERDDAVPAIDILRGPTTDAPRRSGEPAGLAGPTRANGPTPTAPDRPEPARADGPTAIAPDRPGPVVVVPAPVRPPAPSSPAVPSPAPSPPAPQRPAPLALDQRNCPNLDLGAIGDLPPGADAELAAFAPRFRALAPAELARPVLVCAQPIERWRDLVAQQLYVGAVLEGALVAHPDGRHPVLRLTAEEWRSFWFFGGSHPWSHNYLGQPLGRTSIPGADIILTTRGGLVMERADSKGYPVVNGAWDLWWTRGGRAHMGLPTMLPAERADVDGAYQDFANGHINIPGVYGLQPAVAAPTSAYRWTAADVAGDTPDDARGNVLQVDGASYYISPAGTRHWASSAEAYWCAIEENGAREIAVRGWVIGQFPPGEPYRCADDR